MKCLGSGMNHSLTSNNPTYYLLHYGYCRLLPTYIHNWPLPPFSQDYDLASHYPLDYGDIILHMILTDEISALRRYWMKLP